jgi:hypothetical protein
MSNLPEGYLKNLMARAQSGDDVALELLSGNFPGASGTDNESVRKRKEKEAQEDFYRDALRRMLEDIDRRMEELAQRIADLEKEIEQKRKELLELREREAEIERAFQYYYKNGDFELDGKGRLKNKKLEEELRLYELRTGQKVDRNDPRDVFIALQRQKAEIIKLDEQNVRDTIILQKELKRSEVSYAELQDEKNGLILNQKEQMSFSARSKVSLEFTKVAESDPDMDNFSNEEDPSVRLSPTIPKNNF